MAKHVTRATHDKALARIKELEEDCERLDSRAYEWEEKCEASDKRIKELEGEVEERGQTIFFKNSEIDNLKLIIAQLKIRLAKAEGFSQALASQAGVVKPDFQQGLGDLTRPMRPHERSPQPQDGYGYHGQQQPETTRRELWELE